jgi:porin
VDHHQRVRIDLAVADAGEKRNMNTRGIANVIGSILFASPLLWGSVAHGQDPKPSPPSSTVATNAKPADETAKTTTAAPAQKPDPSPSPKPDFWHREQMTGDWDGDRERVKNEGFEIELKLTQFYQGVAAGGLRRSSEYNGVFQTNFKLDFGKMSPSWKFWSAQIQSETRFGGPPVGGTGGINPVNTAAIVPAANGGVVSITAANVTRLIPRNLAKGDLFAVSFGRFNLLDLLDEDFFAGSGTERYFNIAEIGPLTVLRQVPLITNGVSFAYIKGGEPRFTFALIDPNDHSLNLGIKDLFADGVTLSPGFIFPAKHFGKSAQHSFGGAITTKAYTPFDAIRQIVIPGPAINPVTPKRGSWSINYVFRQYIVERGHRDGWGFFTQVSFADKATSPITTFFNAGVGGNGLFKSRSTDEFGIAYAFTDLSKVLKDNIDLLTLGGRRPQPEHQFEVFYNFYLTPWLRLTGDLQIVRGVRPTVSTAVVPGMRLEMIF